jgi:O-antigen/teichoic acid export membrane protein
MAPATSPPDSAAHRDRSLRLAVATSLISKAGTIVLRLVSIPVAVHLLGMEMFGVYTAITMAVGLIDMLHIGIGPALTKGLAQAVARGDREAERTIFGTSILLSMGLTLLAGAAALAVLLRVPIPTLFGSEFAPVGEAMFQAALLGLLIIQVEMIGIPFEMARDGYQETRFTNAWGAGGNVLGAILLLGGIWFFPTIEFLLLAVNGSIAVAKLGNAIHLLRHRPYLLPRLSLFRGRLVPGLARDGIRFSVTYILAAAVEYNLMAFLVGHHIGPGAVGVWNVMVTVHFSLTGLVAMVTRPYWPALMDAFERRDHSWIGRSSNRLRLGGLGFALLAGIGLVAFGTWVLPLWAGAEFRTALAEPYRIDRLALLAFSLYFCAHVWRHINQTLALGVGRVSQVARCVVAEGALLLAAAGFALYQGAGFGVIYLAMAASIALCTGWLLPLQFRIGRRGGDSGTFADEGGCLPPENLPGDLHPLRESGRNRAVASLRSEAAPR